ncbi:MFS transporter [Nocardiopsis gilva YIM 90087]|uniref:MFS transporter n=1 Tax=Nocardiopsis gilva YIM 90087 TaxID=1235441 RepID=A0A223S0T3_9ACTN|nr:MFS transporter [Nocardiopsis gilva]ASU81629.1 MFS transporter [Nocardiopsis gilva YIM 90087]
MSTTPMPRTLLPVLALCCAVTVANIYLSAPLLSLISASLGTSAAQSGLAATFSQLGYSAGLLFLLPLGDTVRRRPLVSWLVVGTVAGLATAALAPGLPALLAAILAASAFSVIPQLLVPMATAMAPPERRARVIATLQAGVFSGAIAARVIGGVIGEFSGWRAVFAIAAVGTAVIGAVTVALLPPDEEQRGGERPSYGALLASLPGLLREPVLRRSLALQASVFAAFNMLWTTLVFLLTAPPYRLDTAAAAYFGLFGLVGVGVAPVAGRFIDRYGPLRVVGVSLAVVAASCVVFLFGRAGLAVPGVAIAVLFAGLQGCQISNQSAALAARPDARSRMNTVYMFGTFLAGAMGSALGATLYEHVGWTAVSAAAGGVTLLGLAVWAMATLREGRGADGSARKAEGSPSGPSARV